MPKGSVPPVTLKGLVGYDPVPINPPIRSSGAGYFTDKVSSASLNPVAVTFTLAVPGVVPTRRIVIAKPW